MITADFMKAIHHGDYYLAKEVIYNLVRRLLSSVDTNERIRSLKLAGRQINRRGVAAFEWTSSSLRGCRELPIRFAPCKRHEEDS